MKTVLLGDIAKIKGGKRLPKGNSLQSIPNAHPYIRIVDMGEKRISKVNLQFVPDTVFPKISRYITNTGDVLLSIVGSPGVVALVDPSLNNASLTENCAKLVIDKGKYSSEFIYYFLASPVGQNEIRSSLVGSTQPKLPLYNIAKIRIPALTRKEQSEIVQLIEVIDEKIELNRRMNEALERVGRTLFKHHFMDNPESKTWPVKKLDELVNIKGGGTPSTKDPSFWDGDIAWTSPRDLTGTSDAFLLDTDKKITEAGLRKVSSGLLPKGTLLLSSRAPIGYIAIAGLPLAVNQGYIAFLAGAKLPNDFMYFWLKQNMDTIKGSANGSTFMEISKTAFRNIETALPNGAKIQEFAKAVEPIFKKMKKGQEEVRNLIQLRDWLLPRLISGRIKV